MAEDERRVEIIVSVLVDSELPDDVLLEELSNTSAVLSKEVVHIEPPGPRMVPNYGFEQIAFFDPRVVSVRRDEHEA